MSGAIESIDTLYVDNICLDAMDICIRSGALCTLGTSSHMEYGSIEAHSSRSISKSWNESFVTQRSQRRCSFIVLEQSYEQTNKEIK